MRDRICCSSPASSPSRPCAGRWKTSRRAPASLTTSPCCPSPSSPWPRRPGSPAISAYRPASIASSFPVCATATWTGRCRSCGRRSSAARRTCATCPTSSAPRRLPCGLWTIRHRDPRRDQSRAAPEPADTSRPGAGSSRTTAPTSSTRLRSRCDVDRLSATPCGRCATRGCASPSTVSTRRGRGGGQGRRGTGPERQRQQSSRPPALGLRGRRPARRPATLDGLDRTVETLTAWGVPFRIDPVLEPIGLGFAASLGRYLEVRRRYPDAEMMMGVGNLTELTDADSAGRQRAAARLLPGSSASAAC